jgi:CubicO group peptidase (beta-lactamase class C family)
MRIHVKVVLGLFLSLGVAGVSPFGDGLQAQLRQPTSAETAGLDGRIQAYMEEANIPGVLVGVASRGRLVHWKAYGMANVELSAPVTDSTVFEIGSISKEFVSTAVMLLVEEGRLDLDDGIHRYLPDLPSEWLGVTIRQLLTHTSGIPDYEEIQTYEAYRFRFTPEEIIRVAHSRPMDFPPGAGYYYSNTGYFLLSMIVERIEGLPLGRVLQARIFDPLGMGQTRMADPERIIRHRAAGYYVDGTGELVNRDATQTLYGEELLSSASKEALWTPVTLPNGRNTGYAFGWRIGEYDGRRTIGHNGMVAGFVAAFLRIPESEMSVIVFANRYRASSSRIRDAVLETFMPAG